MKISFLFSKLCLIFVQIPFFPDLIYQKYFFLASYDKYYNDTTGECVQHSVLHGL